MNSATKRKILIVDDTDVNRKLLASIILKNTEFDVLIADSGKAVIESIHSNIPDLILLDIMMPEMDGFQVAEYLKNHKDTAGIPILFITALDDIESKIRAFDIGGTDYITKPFNVKEVVSRIMTNMKLKSLLDDLEREVRQRTQELEYLNNILVSSLESANYYNDDDTGNHIRRVSYFSKEIAEGLDVERELAGEIYRFASLHDIGKVGIPHSILKKPGKLTDEEWDIMKTHCHIGYKIMDYPGFSQVAKNICYAHHERWDGSGYPRGLKKGDIPLEARIVAVGDVYDALRSVRTYKPAYDHETSARIIVESAGSHFDPKIVEVFKKRAARFDEIYTELNDSKTAGS